MGRPELAVSTSINGTRRPPRNSYPRNDLQRLQQRRSPVGRALPASRQVEDRHPCEPIDRRCEFTRRLGEYISERPQCASVVRCPRKGTVYNCGDRDGNIYLVESGMVKTVMLTPSGKKCILDIYVAGEVLGELSLLSDERLESAVAMRPVVLRQIPARRFFEALTDDEVREGLTQYLTLRILEQQYVIANLVTMESELRLAARLLRLAHKLGRRHPTGTKISTKITQEELSEMVGTTRSRVGYFLKGFRENGLIEAADDAYLVLNEQRLVEFLERMS